MAEEGLYFAWARYFFTFCPRSIFLFFTPTLYSRHFRVESISKNLFLRTTENGVSQGYRKREVVPIIQAMAYCHHNPVCIQVHCQPKELENYGYLSIPLFTPRCASFGKAAEEFALYQI